MLDSQRVHLPQLTLAAVLAEIERWMQAGASRFRRLVDERKLPAPNLPEPASSFLDLLVPATRSQGSG